MGIICANSDFSSVEKPRFKDALMAKSFVNPSKLRCYLFFIIFKACSKSLKSACFWERKLI